MITSKQLVNTLSKLLNYLRYKLSDPDIPVYIRVNGKDIPVVDIIIENHNRMVIISDYFIRPMSPVTVKIGDNFFKPHKVEGSLVVLNEFDIEKIYTIPAKRESAYITVYRISLGSGWVYMVKETSEGLAVDGMDVKPMKVFTESFWNGIFYSRLHYAGVKINVINVS